MYRRLSSLRIRVDHNPQTGQSTVHRANVESAVTPKLSRPLSSKLSTNCFNRRVDVSLGIENMRRDATSVKPSFLGDLDYYSVFLEQQIAESPAVDRVGKLECHKSRRERPGRRTDHLNS